MCKNGFRKKISNHLENGSSCNLTKIKLTAILSNVSVHNKV